MRWPTVAIGEIACLLRNGMSIKQSPGAGGIPITRIETIASERINLSRCGYAGLERKDCSGWLLEYGDILISHINSLAHLGKCAIFEDRAHEVAHGMNLLNLRVDQSVALPRFILHALRSKRFVAQISTIAKKSVNQASFNISTFKELEIPLPPLEEQRRIAAILDQAQYIRDKAARRTDLLLALGRSLFIRSFGLPSENPYQLPLLKLIDICNSKQWPTISSKQLRENGYPVFGANGLIGYFDSFNHPEPTVLVTCRGATCGTVNISPPNCYVTGNSMAMDNPNPDLLTTEYLAWVLRLRGMNDVISGSAQPQITRQGLEAVTIPVPSIEAQNDFAKELSAVTLVTATSRISENSICGVADSLSARLFESSRK
jgi:type I restriction enzyme S subunit